MNKLPFVWELSSNVSVSHAIGVTSVRSMHRPEQYTQDIVQYMDRKNLIFTESSVPYGGTIEAIIADIARAKEVTIRCIATERESKSFYKYYSDQVDTKEAADAYKKGDEAELKKLYAFPMPNHRKINENIVERSTPFIKIVSTLLVANLAHFLVEPSILQMYEEKEIKIKKVQ